MRHEGCECFDCQATHAELDAESRWIRVVSRVLVGLIVVGTVALLLSIPFSPPVR